MPPAVPGDAELDALYAAHVADLGQRYAAAAERGGFDALVVGSGVVQYRFLDDQAHRYVACPHFVQWAPLLEHPGSALVIEPGKKPVLLLLQPEDYWHLPPPSPGPAVAAHFDVRLLGDPAALAAQLPGEQLRTALLGMPEQWQGLLPAAARNPDAVVNYLHFHRARKTAWEVGCMRRAAALAAPGHHAAAAAFRAGGSEYDILNAFLDGCRQTEQDLPYGAIVALNEHGATLHYQHRDRTPPRPRELHSLLIDAGCAFNGYASDITRTRAYRDDEFAGMVADLDELQQQLCRALRPGLAYPDLHRRTHRAVGELLRRWGIATLDAEELVSAGVTFAFFPHGLGHLLGIQVHDVGGHMADDTGAALTAPADFPKLRFLRTLEAGHVVTVEPGVYFIEPLLARLRSGPAARQINWKRVDALKKYGGIRIEDDVLVTADGAENLTRPLLGD